MNKSVEIINNEAESLQSEIIKLKNENERLKEKITKQREAIKLCNREDYNNAKTLIDENTALKKACEEKDKRLEIAKSIIANEFIVIKEVQKASKTRFTREQMKELCRLGFKKQDLRGLLKDVGHPFKVFEDISEYMEWEKTKTNRKGL